MDIQNLIDIGSNDIEGFYTGLQNKGIGVMHRSIGVMHRLTEQTYRCDARTYKTKV